MFQKTVKKMLAVTLVATMLVGCGAAGGDTQEAAPEESTESSDE